MEIDRIRAALTAQPMLNSVGDLMRLLSQLPPDMPLTLDEHVRTDPTGLGQMYTVTPRVIGMYNHQAKPPGMAPGLELGLVCIPAEEDEAEQAAAAVRRDLLPENPLARAEARVQGGAIPAGLKDLTGLLKDAKHLLAESADWLSRDDPAGESLRVEADRIGHAAARIAQLADTVEVPE
ncbi:hypothetical protein ACFC8F_23185 [Streptomyces hydrogenans]|uniref:hypothetical protein n=1 Tax=Streptomyces hydrogenans TaxID=1873719 RepID=UPI0035DDACFA